MKYYISKLSSLLALTLVIVSCSKQEWKKTVSTEVQLQISENKVTYGNSELTIDSLSIQINSLIVDGQRTQAEDIHLTQPSQSHLLTSSAAVSIGSFDIPQGTYESLQLSMSLDVNQNSTVKIRGTYTSPSNSDRFVLIDLDLSQTIVANILSDNEQFVLIQEGVDQLITVNLSPEIIFQNVSNGMWNAAIPSFVDGLAAFEISNNTNTNIYYEILNKFSESISISID